jgi:hypothetical protein
MKQREFKLQNKTNSRQMKKTKTRPVLLYSIIAVIAGVLSGILISSFMWKNEKVSSFKDIFNIEKSENIGSEEKPASSEKKEAGVQAEYKITKGQRYYTKPVEDGDKNILLIGEDASSGNYDTIIIASVSDDNKTIRLINFPRDIYIDYSEHVLSLLKKKSPKLYGAKGFQKINAAHTVGSRIEYEDNMGRFGDSNIDFLDFLTIIAIINMSNPSISAFWRSSKMACDSRTTCTCTYPCSRHGKCCECVAYHRRSGEVPGCFFSKAGEKTYDRSIENLYRDYKESRGR